MLATKHAWSDRLKVGVFEEKKSKSNGLLFARCKRIHSICVNKYLAFLRLLPVNISYIVSKRKLALT